MKNRSPWIFCSKSRRRNVSGNKNIYLLLIRLIRKAPQKVFTFQGGQFGGQMLTILRLEIVQCLGLFNIHPDRF